jgi:serine/threonine protein kinase
VDAGSQPGWGHVLPSGAERKPEPYHDRFHLLERVGSGGLGLVYRALDRRLGREVALKTTMHPDADELHRLGSEFRLLSMIDHVNLVRPYEFFLRDDEAFFTMELVAGTDFVSYSRGTCEPGSCDYGRLRHAAGQLASAIQGVHLEGVLHRDVKPSNVLVTREGRVVLIDFGLAETLDPGSEQCASSGLLLGTHGYVAPEQARGEALSTAADWYSFGVSVYEAATGRLPFANMFEAFVARRSFDELPSIRRLSRHAPEDLDKLIAALLDPVPRRRPTGDDVLRMLDARTIRLE